MKKLLLLPLFFAGSSLLFSCHDMEDNEGKTLVLQDSINQSQIFPTYEALHMQVSDDHKEITVVIGDLKFYDAPADQKNKKAEELGRMILHVYGKNSYLSKGTLIVTKDTRNTSSTPADGIKTPIDIEGLKKVMYPQ